MGSQLLLCASIPHSKYTQTVSTLEALTGILNPQQISTYTLFTKPYYAFKPKFEPGKVNQIEQYYMRCTTIWSDDASSKLDLAQPFIAGESEVLVDRLFAGKEVKHWTFHISDLPNAGKSTVLVHNFHESTLVHHHTKGLAVAEMKTGPDLQKAQTSENITENKTEDGPVAEVIDVIAEEPMVADAVKKEDSGSADLMEVDAPETESKDSFLQFLEALGYVVVNQYWVKGIRFFYGDIIIEIFKVFVRDDDAAPTEDSRLKLKLLDLSNTFQIKAYVNFAKGASVDLVTQGTKDLTKLKEMLANLFELEVPDRMSMDSRVTRTTP